MSDAPPDLLNDARRLDAIRDAVLHEPTADEAFDRLARMATAVLRAPVSLVTVVLGDRQVLKGCVGLPEPWGSGRETPLSHS
ncbi:MAG TPA: hypothetical protein VFH27_05305, partial [Longimicrobiaceae bacterium]|nr:hypothetical protein [Longimicrobiaceae bacterium]